MSNISATSQWFLNLGSWALPASSSCKPIFPLVCWVLNHWTALNLHLGPPLPPAADTLWHVLWFIALSKPHIAVVELCIYIQGCVCAQWHTGSFWWYGESRSKIMAGAQSLIQVKTETFAVQYTFFCPTDIVDWLKLEPFIGNQNLVRVETIENTTQRGFACGGGTQALCRVHREKPKKEKKHSVLVLMVWWRRSDEAYSGCAAFWLQFDTCRI